MPYGHSLTIYGHIHTMCSCAIVAVRPDGGFPSRAALRAVGGIGPKSYEQAAGFLRVPASSIAQSGGEPLDCTAVHPESYAAARVLLAELGHTPAELRSAAGRATIGAAAARALTSVERRVSLAAACAVGERSLTQIGEALNAAERDPRSELGSCVVGILATRQIVANTWRVRVLQLSLHVVMSCT